MSQKNLADAAALKKLKDIVDGIDVGFLCTHAADAEMHAAPMSRQEVDDSGHIWYLISSESTSFEHISQNNSVNLLYADSGNYRFLDVKGKAVISQDKARIEKYWSKAIETWFDKGKEDPRISVLEVIPEDAHYWDTKYGKLVTLFKLASNAITGSKLDLGEEGKLDV